MNKKQEIVPKLRFPEFEVDYNIKFLRGDSLFEPVVNKNHNSDLPLLAITQDQGAVPRDQIDYNVTVTKKSLATYKVVEIGDFIISLRSFQGGIEYSRFKGICSPAYIVLRKKRDDVLERYYKYYFKLENYIQKLNRNLEGIREGKMISYSQFSTIKIPYPSLREQQKVADCLSSIDKLIEAESRKLEILKKYKKGFMQKLFPVEGKTLPEWRFPEFIGGSEWSLKTLGEICVNYDSLRVPITEKDRITGNIPYIGASGIIDYIHDFIFNDDLLCVSEDGANLLARTYPIAFGISGKTWVNNHAHVLKFKFKFTQDMVEAYLNMIDLKDYLTGMAQPKLNRAKLDTIPIPVPGFDEQQKIACCLSEIDSLINAQADKVENLKKHKKGLMQGLFPSFKEADE